MGASTGGGGYGMQHPSAGFGGGFQPYGGGYGAGMMNGFYNGPTNFMPQQGQAPSAGFAPQPAMQAGGGARMGDPPSGFQSWGAYDASQGTGALPPATGIMAQEGGSAQPLQQPPLQYKSFDPGAGPVGQQQLMGGSPQSAFGQPRMRLPPMGGFGGS